MMILFVSAMIANAMVIYNVIYAESLYSKVKIL